MCFRGAFVTQACLMSLILLHDWCLHLPCFTTLYIRVSVRCSHKGKTLAKFDSARWCFGCRHWLQLPDGQGELHQTPAIPAEEMWRGDVFLIFLESSQTHCSQHFPAILISFGFGHQTRGGREFVHMGMQPTAPLMQVQLYLQLGWNVSPLLYLTPLRTHPTPTISERN